MLSIPDLWLPILLSGVGVFIVSSVIHMVTPLHKGDNAKLPGEDQVLEAMRAQGVRPGQYMFPCPSSMKDMCTPEMKARYEKGPVGFMSVLPNGVPNMGRSLVLWFLYSLLVSVFVAYIATQAFVVGTPYMDVFQLAGSVALLGYGIGVVNDTIWKGVRWSTTLKFVFDGILYALVTAGVFGWLWPTAT